MKNANSPEPNDDIANVRVAYQVVMQAIVYEGQLVWRATAVYMAFAGALIFGSIALNIPGVTSAFVSLAVRALLSLIGVVVTFSWWSMVGRSRHYYKYWIAQARSLESKLTGVSTFTKGRELAEGNTVDVSGEDHHMTGIHRIKMTVHFHLLYAATFLFFVALFFMNIVAASRAY